MKPSVHLEQLPFLFQKKIDLPASSQKELDKTDLLINCASPPNSAFYVLTDFRDKPLLMWSPQHLSKAYFPSYLAKMRELNAGRLDEYGRLDFLLLEPLSYYGKNYAKGECVHLLEEHGAIIEKTAVVNDFLGNSHIKLNLVTGKLKI